MPCRSSILYRNPEDTVFLIDIPTSITQAQELSHQLHPCLLKRRESTSEEQATTRYLRSSSPLRTPYPPNTEPKTESARARVLARIPVTERIVHEAIEPVVLDALKVLKCHYGQASNWCLERRFLRDEVRNELRKNEVIASSAIASERPAKRRWEEASDPHEHEYYFQPSSAAKTLQRDSGSVCQPPLILSPGSNSFKSGAELCDVVARNTSFETALATIRSSHLAAESTNGPENGDSTRQKDHIFIIPPLSNFVLCNIPISPPAQRNHHHPHPIPGVSPDQKFNLVLLDPPWSNRSVRRSKHYHTQAYNENQLLEKKIQDILQVHSLPISDQSPTSIAAIWITNSAKARDIAYNSLSGAEFSVIEEWVWVKTTVDGQPISPVAGLWRKPYEVLVIGRKQDTSKLGSTADIECLRRVIAAVPDVHSRKPNLREIFEKVFFQQPGSGSGVVPYSALEAFARNLTAGWWACGNEVLKFNAEDWWVGK
ncbi:MT-A70-domain-containing protein [Aspergillus karnatakaensis]|uniref:MT-A70 family n=1 Tax=Aspergillus karnatakaensis TaxID=1810916 RepID=UPI003CCE0286